MKDRSESTHVWDLSRNQNIGGLLFSAFQQLYQSGMDSLVEPEVFFLLLELNGDALSVLVLNKNCSYTTSCGLPWIGGK